MILFVIFITYRTQKFLSLVNAYIRQNCHFVLRTGVEGKFAL